MKKYLKDLVPLVGICLVAALLLGIFNLITEGPIAENSARAAQQTRSQLLSAAASFEPVELEEGSNMDSCYQGLDAGGEPVGYVVATTVGGYGGEIVVTVGVDNDNVITGINVGGDNFSETAGLGAKAKEPAFTDQFKGKTVPLKLIKANGEKGEDTIDAISGATITSTAVNGGVNSAAKFIMDMNGGAASPNTASVQGFAGPVAVTLSLDDAGAITEIAIGDAFFNETEGFGRRALEEEFQQQFIGKVPPLTLEDIDALSGATITSTAVVNAINQVQAQLSGAAPVSAPAAEEAEPVSAAGENAKTASKQGFAGPVAVAVDLDENGAIAAITIGDDSFAETAGLGAKALEDAFKAQFIGKVPPLTLEDIDAITGATVTSTAVVDAINAACGVAEEPAPAAEEAEPVPAAGENAKTASKQGFAGPVAVAVDLDENGAIAAITIGDDSFAETDGLGAKALEDAFKAQFIGKVPPLTLEDIDAITGATVTSTAVVDAINAACGVVEAPAEEPAATEAPASKAAAATGETRTGSAKGFAGPVAVEVTVDNNAITAIKIGDDQFCETDGLGAKALEEDFQKQFIGRTLPIALEDIDAITGATVTSAAVVDAINAACGVAEEPAEEPAATEAPAEEPAATEAPAEEPAATEAPAEEPAATDAPASEPAAVTGETRTGSAKGFAGPVAVEVTVDNNTITAIKIGDDQFCETDGLGAKALEEDFQKQFIGKTLPIALEDIDAITGATVTSAAVVDAINAACGVVEAPAEEPAATEAPAEEPAATEAPAEEPAATEAPASKAAAATGETRTGSAKGFAGPVAVEVTVDNNAITAIKIGDDQFCETDGLGAKALEEDFQKQFIGKTLPIALEDIDAITGATVTSAAVVDAINSAK